MDLPGLDYWTIFWTIFWTNFGLFSRPAFYQKVIFRAGVLFIYGAEEVGNGNFSNSLIIHKVNYKSLHVYHITCLCLDTQ